MDGNRFYRLTTLALVTGGLALGLTACGSDDGSGSAESSTNAPTEATKSTPTGATQEGTTGKTGEFTPEKKAPDSAGDKRGNAPDDVISERPGGPADPQPVSP